MLTTQTTFEPFADVQRAALQIVADHITKEEGGTFATDGQRIERTTGYAVGGREPGIVVALGDNIGQSVGTAVTQVAQWLQALPSNVQYVGTWEDDGLVYVDTVDIVEDRGDAFALARDRGEKAIYSFGHEFALFLDRAGWT